MYDMSGRRSNTDSPWRGREHVHAGHGQSSCRLRQCI